MSEKNAEATTSFKDQMDAERQYYLGKTDTIPGTDKTISDARAEHREREADSARKLEERRIAYLKSEQPQEGVVHTTVVTPGVLASVEPKSQIEVSEAEIEAIDSGAADNTNIAQPQDLVAPREKLMKEGKESLYEQASGLRQLGPVGDYNKEQLADVILAEKDNIEV